MHIENLNFLYREYRNCMREQFSDYFGKDDTYKSYEDKCHPQKMDIEAYYDSYLGKAGKIDPSREMREVTGHYESQYQNFAQLGWTAQETKN